jgi:hypothetical protein
VGVGEWYEVDALRHLFRVASDQPTPGRGPGPSLLLEKITHLRDADSAECIVGERFASYERLAEAFDLVRTPVGQATT